jgi:hypothetical protein
MPTSIAALLCCGPVVHAAAAEPEMKWGYQYLEPCSKSSSNRPLCLRFIDGFLLGAAWQAERSKTRLEYCLPKETDLDTVADAFHNWMVETDVYRYLKADGLLFLVLTAKWPCRSS